jgi:regulator of sigma E protease
VPSDLFHSLISNVWSIFLVVLFFGGSIFVHELGHFLAARRRGVHVSRFSIGFGPKIFSWHGRDGVEYRLSWLPLGGYVALPQLADMRGIEGESDVDVDELPPISYATKMIVFAAGAAFNVLFAFVLACIIWVAGQEVRSDITTRTIGYIAPKLELADHSKVPSPASVAGLRAGDVVLAIDGHAVKDWPDLQNSLTLGSGHNEAGERQAVFTVQRNGQIQDIIVHPRLSGEDGVRRVGISPWYQLFVGQVPAGSIGEKIGLKPQDELLQFDGQPIGNGLAYEDYLTSHADAPVTLKVKRQAAEVAVTVPPRAKNPADLGIGLIIGSQMTHPSPFSQVAEFVGMTFQTIGSLLNPHSDIGLSKMSGPVGIAHIFHEAAQAGLRAVLWFTILINVNLAIFNLLPIPVLDGGHMLFATIARLRGRALPLNFIMTAQSVFMVLLLSMVLYVTVFDVKRWPRESRSPERSSETTSGSQAGK